MRMMIYSRLVLGCALSVFLAGCSGLPSTSNNSTDSDGSLPSPDGAVSTGPAPASTASALPDTGNGSTVPVADAPAAAPETANMPVPAAAPTVSSATPGSTHRVEVVSSSLHGKLTVSRINSSRATGLLAVSAEMRNRTSHRLEIQVQTVFKDQTGLALTNQEGSWETVTMKAHQETPYQATASSAQAAEFLIRLRVPQAEQASQ